MELDNLNNEFFEIIGKCYHDYNSFNIFSEYYQGEMRILSFLSKCDTNNVLPTNLVKELNMSSPRISSALKNLEKKGFINREFSTTDRRKVYVNITNTGKQYVFKKTSEIYNLFYAMFKELGIDDTKELIRIIDKLNNIFSDIKHK